MKLSSKSACFMALLGALVFASACENKEKAKEPAAQTDTKEEPKAEAKTPLQEARDNAGAFAALPEHYKRDDQTKEQEDLGRMLYYDARLSKNHDISCNSCHQLDNFGVDAEPTSPGHKKQRGDRNSPTVYNAAGHLAQFWDGRAKDVEEQAKGPVLNPVEMAMAGEEQVVSVLKSIPGYEEPFKKAFPDAEDPINYDNMAKAIGAFERNLVTPSRWDKFLAGDDKALTEDELKGFNLFASTGCTSCHNGALVGGTSYQKLGAIKPWPNTEDQGRFAVTKKEEDKMSFKVPSLRNITKTGPYFHDGKTESLEEAVKMMATHQLGAELKEDEVKLIVAWLDTLTGEVPKDYIAKPELPESGPKTPAPDPS